MATVGDGGDRTIHRDVSFWFRPVANCSAIGRTSAHSDAQPCFAPSIQPRNQFSHWIPTIRMRQPQAQSGSGRALATGHFPTKTLDRAGQSFVPGEWNRIDFCVPAGWLWRGAARWGMRFMLLTLDFAGSQGRKFVASAHATGSATNHSRSSPGRRDWGLKREGLRIGGDCDTSPTVTEAEFRLAEDRQWVRGLQRRKSMEKWSPCLSLVLDRSDECGGCSEFCGPQDSRYWRIVFFSLFDPLC